MLPFVYIRGIPKKDSISLLFNGLNHWMKVPEDKLETCKEIFSTLYNQGLL